MSRDRGHGGGGERGPPRPDQGRPPRDDDLVTPLVARIEKPAWQDLMRDGGFVDKYAQAEGMKDLKPSQMRKFFDEVRSCEKALKDGKDDWDARLWQIVPLVKFSSGRGLCPKIFVDFISRGVEKVMQGKDKQEKAARFGVFLKIFEAIVAYQTYYK